MLVYAIIIFAIAALGGLILAFSVLRGKSAPWALSLLHGGLGAVGLILVLLTVMNGEGRVILPLVFLAIAAFGGLYLAMMHVRRQTPPKLMVVVHAGAALAGFALLISMVYIHNLT